MNKFEEKLVRQQKDRSNFWYQIMKEAKKRLVVRAKKKRKIRENIEGTEHCPRVSVYRSSKHIYVQVIDDAQGKTLCAASTVEKGAQKKEKNGGNIASAIKIGESIGKKLEKIGVKKIVFDRNGFFYHGRIKSLSDGIRSTGIKF